MNSEGGFVSSGDSGSRSSGRTGKILERAFLVGIDYRGRGVSGGEKHLDDGATGRASKGKGQMPLTAGARAAHNVALSGAGGAKAARTPGFSAEESLAELHELASSAGAEVVGQFLQKRDRPDAATLIGRGKLEEISGTAASAGADLLIFDHDLTPSQQRNIESEVKARVVDRTQLILDIFARHARTSEGQLQVELAQLKYLMPRLAGRGKEMSQLGGGIGTRGPGETQLETDRRKISRRVRALERQIENVRRIRAQQRQRRESVPVATVALVGYTNAGKSTTFNSLTNAGVLESGKMFATLDPTIRGVVLPSKRKVLLSDTVGFIRSLPHTLVSAFRATLEEVQRAELILQVSDAVSPIAAEQDAQVEQVLQELDAAAKPRIHVINKIDLLSSVERGALSDDETTVHISAKNGTGLGALLERIDEMLSQDALCRVRLRVPQSEGKVLAQLEARARIYDREYRDGLVELEVQAPESVVRRVKKFVVK